MISVRVMKMSGKINFDDYVHVGVIVKNIEETLAKMEKIFDIQEYRINDFPPKDAEDVQLMYHGSKAKFTARFCFIKMADRELELIEPVEGNSVWKDFLEEKGEGIHHLKYEIESINETMKFFKEQGIDCPQYGAAVGPNTGRTWAYFDTVDELGYVIEVFNRRVGEKVED